MAKLGQPALPHPRRQGIFVRFSDTERGALERALQAEHLVSHRRPPLPEWIRDLVVAHAGQILGVDVTRATLRPATGGIPNWKRWRLARAVRRAAPRADDAMHRSESHGINRSRLEGEIPFGLPIDRSLPRPWEQLPTVWTGTRAKPYTLPPSHTGLHRRPQCGQQLQPSSTARATRFVRRYQNQQQKRGEMPKRAGDKKMQNKEQ